MILNFCKWDCEYRNWSVHDRNTEHKCVGGYLDGYLCEDDQSEIYECEWAKLKREQEMDESWKT